MQKCSAEMCTRNETGDCLFELNFKKKRKWGEKKTKHATI